MIDFFWRKSISSFAVTFFLQETKTRLALAICRV